MYTDLVSLNGARPIVARFIYRKDMDSVLKNAYKLKGKLFGINEQFPMEIKMRCKLLYPVLRKAIQEGKQVRLVKDKLFINGQLYRNTEQQRIVEYRDALMKEN